MYNDDTIIHYILSFVITVSGALWKLLYGRVVSRSELCADLDMATSGEMSLSDCDKIMMIDDEIPLLLSYASQVPTTIQIINHRLLSDEKIITMYENGYRLVYNNNIDTLRDITRATINGMRIIKLRVYDINVVSTNACSNIQELTLTSNRSQSTAHNVTFAKSLRKLSMYDECNITNDNLKLCINIEELRADDNAQVTTCEPFAKSLRKLSAYNKCGIADDGLKLCTNIEDLDITNNTKVTTCVPFAKSLRKLCVMQYRHYVERIGMRDNGLSCCKNITFLNASDYGGIATCEPFAESLTVLWAHGLWGTTITDGSLTLCTNIKYLYADDNRNITTCAPFAMSLMKLSARSVCGISDDGLKLCAFIENLNASDNYKITTCAPFAKSLRILCARSNCGITNAGLRPCKNIEDLDVGYNTRITTCAPFARSLRRLRGSHVSNIPYDDVCMCTHRYVGW